MKVSVVKLEKVWDSEGYGHTEVLLHVVNPISPLPPWTPDTPSDAASERYQKELDKIYAHHDVVCFPQEIFIYDGGEDCCSFSFSVSFSFLFGSCAVGGGRDCFSFLNLDPPYFQSTLPSSSHRHGLPARPITLEWSYHPVNRCGSHARLLWCSNHGQVVAQGFHSGGGL